MDISGKVALVTGAVGGLGYGFTRAFLAKQCKVCLVDINDTKGQADEESLNAEFGDNSVLFVKCDVSNEEDFKRAYDRAQEKLGVVEIVCNNAGIVGEFTPSHLITQNLTSVCYGMNIAIERMRKDTGGKGGVIVNTSSISGLEHLWFQPVYSATKAAIYSLTKAWSINPNASTMGIRFNALCPSAVITSINNNIEERVLDVTAHSAYNLKHGSLAVDEVAVAMLRLIEEDRNGDALCISKDGGTRFIELRIVDI